MKVERDAQEYADKEGVKIFTAEIIYHLFDKFTAYCEVSILSRYISLSYFLRAIF